MDHRGTRAVQRMVEYAPSTGGLALWVRHHDEGTTDAPGPEAPPPVTTDGLTLRYGLFFAVVAVVNEVVWRTQSDDTWIAFRGGLWMASSAFGIWQVFYIMKHMIKDETVEPTEPDPGL